SPTRSGCLLWAISGHGDCSKTSSARPSAHQEHLRSYRRSGASELTWLQSKGFDGGLWEQPICLNFLVGSHDLRNNRLRFGRVLFSDVIDCAHRRAAAQPFSCYKDNLTIRHVDYSMTGAVLSSPSPRIIDLRVEGPKLHSVECTRTQAMEVLP